MTNDQTAQIPPSSAPSEHSETCVRIANFLRAVRIKTKWHENLEPLVAGDITPYLQMIMVAAIGTLAIKIPQGNLEVVRAVDDMTGSPLPAKWWTFRYGEDLFDIEGPTNHARIGKAIKEQLACNAIPISRSCRMGLDGRPDIERLFEQAQGPGLKAYQVAQACWAEQVEAPSLHATTPPRKSRAPSQRL